MVKKLPEKAWVVTVDMGYGHQRAAYPLKHFAQGPIIVANNYRGIPEKDKKIWQESRSFYEFISRFKMVPLIGNKIFEIYDKVQAIPSFYPRRDLSKPNAQVKQIYALFKTLNWGKHLIERLAKKPLPLVTTFFITAMMAEHYNYPGEIYCVLCDADISRSWVPPQPKYSRIIYLASNKRVEERLKLYGVDSKKIYLTGFPLPEENVGEKLHSLKRDLGRRLIQLDPRKVYLSRYRSSIASLIGRNNYKSHPVRPLTITFAVGGAGAQRELGAEILRSLRRDINGDRVRLNLVAGVNEEVNKFFRKAARSCRLNRKCSRNVKIIFAENKMKYFAQFNKVLRETDILWTKPSELSFYCALGLPVIVAPPIGSQELFNQKWLESIGAGMDQDDPRYTNEWLWDWINSGWLAEAAMAGFTEAPKYGLYNIQKIIFHHFKEAKKVQTILQY